MLCPALVQKRLKHQSRARGANKAADAFNPPVLLGREARQPPWSSWEAEAAGLGQGLQTLPTCLP